MADRLARQIATDVLVAGAVWGVAEWVATGDASMLSRPWRRVLVLAAERVARRLP